MLTHIEEACQYVHVPLVAENQLEDQVQFDGQQFCFFCHARILVWKGKGGQVGKGDCHRGASVAFAPIHNKSINRDGGAKRQCKAQQ